MFVCCWVREGFDVRSELVSEEQGIQRGTMTPISTSEREHHDTVRIDSSITM
jgi:hypothetical protein